MRRYTESNNIRFEIPINERLKEIIQTDPFCIKKNYSKSDLVRQLLRMGLKEYEKNINHKKQIQRGELYG